MKVHNKHFSRYRQRIQRGFIHLLLLLFAVLGLTMWGVSQLQQWWQDAEQTVQKKTDESLAGATDALFDYALLPPEKIRFNNDSAAYNAYDGGGRKIPFRYFALPCPDVAVGTTPGPSIPSILGDQNLDGLSDILHRSCGPTSDVDLGFGIEREAILNSGSRFGRLPWRTQKATAFNYIYVRGLGGVDFRDGYNERLWYGVARNLADPQRPLNPHYLLRRQEDWMSIYKPGGELLSDRVAAWVIAPGLYGPGNEAGRIPEGEPVDHQIYDGYLEPLEHYRGLVTSPISETVAITINTNIDSSSADQVDFLTIDELAAYGSPGIAVLENSSENIYDLLGGEGDFFGVTELMSQHLERYGFLPEPAVFDAGLVTQYSRPNGAPAQTSVTVSYHGVALVEEVLNATEDIPPEAELPFYQVPETSPAVPPGTPVEVRRGDTIPTGYGPVTISVYATAAITTLEVPFQQGARLSVETPQSVAVRISDLPPVYLAEGVSLQLLIDSGEMQPPYGEALSNLDTGLNTIPLNTEEVMILSAANDYPMTLAGLNADFIDVDLGEESLPSVPIRQGLPVQANGGEPFEVILANNAYGYLVNEVLHTVIAYPNATSSDDVAALPPGAVKVFLPAGTRIPVDASNVVVQLPADYTLPPGSFYNAETGRYVIASGSEVPVKLLAGRGTWVTVAAPPNDFPVVAGDMGILPVEGAGQALVTDDPEGGTVQLSDEVSAVSYIKAPLDLYVDGTVIVQAFSPPGRPRFNVNKQPLMTPYRLPPNSRFTAPVGSHVVYPPGGELITGDQFGFPANSQLFLSPGAVLEVEANPGAILPGGTPLGNAARAMTTINLVHGGLVNLDSQVRFDFGHDSFLSPGQELFDIELRGEAELMALTISIEIREVPVMETFTSTDPRTRDVPLTATITIGGFDYEATATVTLTAASGAVVVNTALMVTFSASATVTTTLGATEIIRPFMNRRFVPQAVISLTIAAAFFADSYIRAGFLTRPRHIPIPNGGVIDESVDVRRETIFRNAHVAAQVADSPYNDPIAIDHLRGIASQYGQDSTTWRLLEHNGAPATVAFVFDEDTQFLIPPNAAISLDLAVPRPYQGYDGAQMTVTRQVRLPIGTGIYDTDTTPPLTELTVSGGAHPQMIVMGREQTLSLVEIVTTTVTISVEAATVTNAVRRKGNVEILQAETSLTIAVDGRFVVVTSSAAITVPNGIMIHSGGEFDQTREALAVATVSQEVETVFENRLALYPETDIYVDLGGTVSVIAAGSIVDLLDGVVYAPVGMQRVKRVADDLSIRSDEAAYIYNAHAVTLVANMPRMVIGTMPYTADVVLDDMGMPDATLTITDGVTISIQSVMPTGTVALPLLPRPLEAAYISYNDYLTGGAAQVMTTVGIVTATTNTPDNKVPDNWVLMSDFYFLCGFTPRQDAIRLNRGDTIQHGIFCEDPGDLDTVATVPMIEFEFEVNIAVTTFAPVSVAAEQVALAVSDIILPANSYVYVPAGQDINFLSDRIGSMTDLSRADAAHLPPGAVAVIPSGDAAVLTQRERAVEVHTVSVIADVAADGTRTDRATEGDLTLNFTVTSTITTSITINGPAYINLNDGAGGAAAFVNMPDYINRAGPPLIFLSSRARIFDSAIGEESDRERIYSYIPPSSRLDLYGNIEQRLDSGFYTDLIPADSRALYEDFPMMYAVAPECRRAVPVPGSDCAEGDGEGLEFELQSGEEYILQEPMELPAAALITSAYPNVSLAIQVFEGGVEVQNRDHMNALLINHLDGSVEVDGAALYTPLSNHEIRIWAAGNRQQNELRAYIHATLEFGAPLDDISYIAVTGTLTVYSGGYVGDRYPLAAARTYIPAFDSTVRIDNPIFCTLPIPGFDPFNDTCELSFANTLSYGAAARLNLINAGDKFLGNESASVEVIYATEISTLVVTLDLADYVYTGNGEISLTVSLSADAHDLDSNGYFYLTATAGGIAAASDQMLNIQDALGANAARIIHVADNAAIPMETGYLWQGYVPMRSVWELSQNTAMVSTYMKTIDTQEGVGTTGLQMTITTAVFPDNMAYLRIQPTVRALNLWGSGIERPEAIDSASNTYLQQAGGEPYYFYGPSRHVRYRHRGVNPQTMTLTLVTGLVEADAVTEAAAELMDGNSAGSSQITHVDHLSIYVAVRGSVSVTVNGIVTSTVMITTAIAHWRPVILTGSAGGPMDFVMSHGDQFPPNLVGAGGQIPSYAINGSICQGIPPIFLVVGQSYNSRWFGDTRYRDSLCTIPFDLLTVTVNVPPGVAATVAAHTRIGYNSPLTATIGNVRSTAWMNYFNQSTPNTLSVDFLPIEWMGRRNDGANPEDGYIDNFMCPGGTASQPGRRAIFNLPHTDLAGTGTQPRVWPSAERQAAFFNGDLDLNQVGLVDNGVYDAFAPARAAYSALASPPPNDNTELANTNIATTVSIAIDETTVMRLTTAMDWVFYMDSAYYSEADSVFSEVPQQTLFFGDRFLINGPAAIVPPFAGSSEKSTREVYAERSRLMRSIFGYQPLHTIYDSVDNSVIPANTLNDCDVADDCPALYNNPNWFPIVGGIISFDGLQVKFEGEVQEAAVDPGEIIPLNATEDSYEILSGVLVRTYMRGERIPNTIRDRDSGDIISQFTLTVISEYDSGDEVRLMLPQPQAVVENADGEMVTIVAGSMIYPRRQLIQAAEPLPAGYRLISNGDIIAHVDVSPVRRELNYVVRHRQPQAFDGGIFNFAPTRAEAVNNEPDCIVEPLGFVNPGPHFDFDLRAINDPGIPGTVPQEESTPYSSNTSYSTTPSANALCAIFPMWLGCASEGTQHTANPYWYEYGVVQDARDDPATNWDTPADIEVGPSAQAVRAYTYEPIRYDGSFNRGHIADNDGLLLLSRYYAGQDDLFTVGPYEVVARTSDGSSPPAIDAALNRNTDVRLGNPLAFPWVVAASDADNFQAVGVDLITVAADPLTDPQLDYVTLGVRLNSDGEEFDSLRLAHQVIIPANSEVAVNPYSEDQYPLVGSRVMLVTELTLGAGDILPDRTVIMGASRTVSYTDGVMVRGILVRENDIIPADYLGDTSFQVIPLVVTLRNPTVSVVLEESDRSYFTFPTGSQAFVVNNDIGSWQAANPYLGLYQQGLQITLNTATPAAGVMTIASDNDAYRTMDVGGRHVVHYQRSESSQHREPLSGVPIHTNVWLRLPEGGILASESSGDTIELPPNSIVNPVVGTYLVNPYNIGVGSGGYDNEYLADAIAYTDIEIARPALIFPPGARLVVGEAGGVIRNVKAAAFFSLTPLEAIQCPTGALDPINGQPDRITINQLREGVLENRYEDAASGRRFSFGHPCAWLDDPENMDGDRQFIYRGRRRFFDDQLRVRPLGNDRTFLLGGQLEINQS